MNGQGWRGQQLESRESLEWQAAGLEPWTLRTSGLCVLSIQTARSDGRGRAEPRSSGIWPCTPSFVSGHPRQPLGTLNTDL